MVPLKNIISIALVSILSLGCLSFIFPDSNKIADKGFAVIELFTSEGCSSCPPADELLARIQKETNDLPIYILAYHVDYWNRLGWKDSFSSATYSERQNRYARWLNGSLYTPQAIVNGSKEFVGSEEVVLRNAIKQELLKESTTQLTLSGIRKDAGKINLVYHVQGKPTNTSLLLALVEKNAVSKVLKGENRGLTLSHVQIVRNLQTIDLKGQNDGSTTVEIARDLEGQNLELIAFLQNNDNGKIIAATKSGIDTPYIITNK